MTGSKTFEANNVSLLKKH